MNNISWFLPILTCLAAGPDWNGSNAIKQEALHLPGDERRGAALYESCSQCHGADGMGSRDGKIPVIARQHFTVLIKQLDDIKRGVRANPEMRPHLDGLVAPRDFADVAAYVTWLERRTSNQKGPGLKSYARTGSEIYFRSCVKCHGPEGQGDLGHFQPRIANQHHDYLVRQLTSMREGSRGNTHPAMAEVLRDVPDDGLFALADYLSRMKPHAGQGRSD